MGAETILVLFLNLSYGEYVRQENVKKRDRAEAHANIALKLQLGFEVTTSFSGSSVSMIYGYGVRHGIITHASTHDNFTTSPRAFLTTSSGQHEIRSGDNRMNSHSVRGFNTNTPSRIFIGTEGQRFVVGRSYYQPNSNRPYVVVTVEPLRTFRFGVNYSSTAENGRGAYLSYRLVTYNVVTFNRNVALVSSGGNGWYATPNQSQDGFGIIENTRGEAGKNQFLMVQEVIGLGNIPIYHFRINDRDSEDTLYKDSFNVSIIVPDIDIVNDTALCPRNPVAEAQFQTDERGTKSFPRDSTSRYHNFTNATLMYRKSLDINADRRYPDIPRGSYIHGPSLIIDASTLSSDPDDDIVLEHTNDIASCVYDFLTSSIAHVPFFDKSDINDESFRLASVQNTVYQTYQASRNLDAIHLQSNPKLGKIKRYEANGGIDTSLSLKEGISRLKAACPGVIISEDNNNQAVISLPDIAGRIDATLTDNDILANTMLEQSPGTDSKTNRVIVTYVNMINRGIRDSVIYQDDQFIRDDAKVLPIELQVAMVATPSHAYNVARWLTLTSRYKEYTFKARARWGVLAPGDIIIVTSIFFRFVNKRMRVININPLDSLVVIINAVEHVPNDWKPIIYTG